MPLFKLFGIIENLLGFVDDKQECHYKSDHSKRKISESTGICINCVNKNISHVSVPLTDFSLVS
jgi:hypothetical protein